VTTPAGAPASGLAPGADGLVWHALSADRVLQAEKVDGQRGLSAAEVVSRARQFGPNAFDAGTVESRWRAFVRQYADPMPPAAGITPEGCRHCKTVRTGHGTGSNEAVAGGGHVSRSAS
jgi:hypothetical protein